MVSKKSRTAVRENKHRRMRHHLAGTAMRPRLAVFRSNNHMYAQIIDDTVGNTLVAASTLDKDVKAACEKTNNVDAAAQVGTAIAKKALEKGITTVVFDRGGFIYQGKVKAPVSYTHLDVYKRQGYGWTQTRRVRSNQNLQRTWKRRKEIQSKIVLKGGYIHGKRT